MAEIVVRGVVSDKGEKDALRSGGAGGAFVFDVEVREGGRKTDHTVTVAKPDYERLTGGPPEARLALPGGRISPEELVKKSFEFLLKREPKESILREFDITVISKYFPEYEKEILR